MMGPELAGVPGWAILLMLIASVMLIAWWLLEVDEDRQRDEEERSKIYDWRAEGDFDE